MTGHPAFVAGVLFVHWAVARDVAVAAARVAGVGIPVGDGSIRGGNGHFQRAVAQGFAGQRRARILRITFNTTWDKTRMIMAAISFFFSSPSS